MRPSLAPTDGGGSSRGSFDTLIGAEGTLDELVGSGGSLDELAGSGGSFDELWGGSDGTAGSADVRGRTPDGPLDGPASTRGADAAGLPHFSASARSSSSPRAAEDTAIARTSRAR
jgi:hypothetical protein